MLQQECPASMTLTMHHDPVAANMALLNMQTAVAQLGKATVMSW